MGLLINILLALIFAALGFLFKLALIYYAIAFLLMALCWAFYATAVGWYLIVGMVLVIAIVRATASRKDAVGE